jgi:hypothetical protein
MKATKVTSSEGQWKELTEELQPAEEEEEKKAPPKKKTAAKSTVPEVEEEEDLHQMEGKRATIHTALAEQQQQTRVMLKQQQEQQHLFLLSLTKSSREHSRGIASSRYNSSKGCFRSRGTVSPRATIRESMAATLEEPFGGGEGDADRSLRLASNSSRHPLCQC